MRFYSDVKLKAEPSVRDRFVHISEEIEAIEFMLAGIAQEQLAEDELRRMAMERMFEIIGIASDHIPANLKAQEVEVDWQAIAELSDRLGNALDCIETAVLWNMAHEKLPPLLACAKRQLRNPAN